MKQYQTIAETQHFIVLDHYEKASKAGEAPAGYQTEAQLERELIEDLVNQGYEYRGDIKTPEQLMANIRAQLEELNKTGFSDREWERFVNEYLDKPNDGQIEKTRRIQDHPKHDFVFDDGTLKNIYLADKEHPAHNKLQVINQLGQAGLCRNRYDVTILVNGIPMVQVELKKRGVAIREAFNQVHRYTKESFNAKKSMFGYVQIFVISNGTDTRYFANTVKRDKNSFDFTMNWAKADNTLIRDLKDFTGTFLQKQTLSQVLFRYSVFDVSDTLLVMRPYQIAATERILWKIRSAYEQKQWGTTEGGGYIWHTTGSGKTLTSFKAARLATRLDFIDKVFFVVDRKDLDNQTMKEYQKFSPDSVNGSPDTAALKRNIERNDRKIIVTTIQKLNNLMRSEDKLAVYDRQTVFIFDEAHRSQFGEAQRNLRRKFKKYYLFGFTGTPIFPENAIGAETTASVFGRQLHAYVITDAIRDEKVLKFKVDYNDVRPRFKSVEMEQDEEKLSAAETRRLLLHPERISKISKYILDNFNIKTHRNRGNANGFNAMFAVNSVEAAKLYYQELNKQQENRGRKLRIAAIFSYAPNEEQAARGEIKEENFNPAQMEQSSKEFLAKAVDDYNRMFGTNYSIDSTGFQDYYRNLAERVRNKEVDLLIVVGMFLTGFDAPGLNTLFVDKNLRYHGLIQAYSRTNRIYDATKTFGNIVTFRNLEQPTIDAIRLFGDKNTRNVVLEKSYQEYLGGFIDVITGKARRGYIEVVRELKEEYPDADSVETEEEKKSFVRLFGEYMKIENILQNYDEFTYLKELRKIDKDNPQAAEEFKERYFLTDDDVEEMRKIDVLDDRAVQDYRSMYNDIRDWMLSQRQEQETGDPAADWDDVVFEIDLLKSQEIDLDYILELIFEHHKENDNKELLIGEVRRVIRSSLGNRAKESLIIDFIHQADLNAFKDKAEIIEAFFTYAQERQKEEAENLISEEGLMADAARRYMQVSLRREYATLEGTDLNEALPKMSPLNPQYLVRKKSVFDKIVRFVEKFKGIGGQL